MLTGRRLALGMLVVWVGSCSPQSIDRSPSIDDQRSQPPPVNPEIAGTGGAAAPVLDGGGDDGLAAAGGAGGNGDPVTEPPPTGSEGSGGQGGLGENSGQGGSTVLADAGSPPPLPDSAPPPGPPDALPPPVDVAAVPDLAPLDTAVSVDSAVPPMAPATVAFVVGSAANPTPGDRRLAARMIERGLRVRLVDHTLPGDALSAAQLVLISASCASANIGATFRAVALPVVSLEAFVFDDMGLTGAEKSVDFDEDQGTVINITNVGHELAAGLSGSLTVAASPANLAWGRPSATAVTIAVLATSSAKTALFAYDRGTLMAGLAAPARRVGFFATETLAETLSDAGLALFDAAIAWALR
jgi:hypothetical protein